MTLAVAEALSPNKPKPALDTPPWLRPGFGSGPGTGHYVPLAVGRWFPPGAPVSSTSETDISSTYHNHPLDMTLAVAETLKSQQTEHSTLYSLHAHDSYIGECRGHMKVVLYLGALATRELLWQTLCGLFTKIM